MSFDKKHKFYKNLSEEEINTLKNRLIKNLNESQLELDKYLKSIRGMNNTVVYLINELLEDKEHLDALQAVIINKTY